MKRIPLLAPTFPCPAAVAQDYAAIVESGVFSNGGPMEAEFSSQLERWIGNDTHIAVVSSGTAGLFISVSATFHATKRLALVPAFTFAAGPLVLRSLGYQPVFLDLDPGSWQPALEQASKFLDRNSQDTAGILLTTTFGIANPEVPLWEELAADHDVPLVIDSAAGFGSTYEDGEALGRRGSCEVFSFHATKVLAVGEGGAVASRDADLIEDLKRRRNFGFDEHRQAVAVGFNAKLPELSCAIGIRQLDALPERLTRRRSLISEYRGSLSPIGFEFPPLVDRAALPFLPVLVPLGANRDRIMDLLEAADIESRCYYNPPAHRHPVFESDAVFADLVRVTESFAGRILSLPLADQLSESDIARIRLTLEHALDVDSTDV